MTVVVAARDEESGKVWMAADAMSTDMEFSTKTQNELVYPKVIEVGDVLIGLAGEHITHTIMRYHKPPAPKPTDDTVPWLQLKLLPWLEKQLKKIDPHKERSCMLVARGSELFQMELQNNDAVPQNVGAIGTGGPYALGALHALREVTIMTWPDRMQAAIRAAAHHDPYCGGRIDVLSTGDA